MAPGNARSGSARGSSLLEAVIALSILLVGILGTFQLQIFGVTADEGARANTEAAQIGHELLVALEQLGPEDPRIGDNFTGGANPPPGFGRLLLPDDTLSTLGYHEYDDALGLRGVTTDAELLARNATDPVDASLPRFQRRWTVWSPEGPILSGGSRLIAVSVVYRERGIQRPRELVFYGTVINPAAVTSYANFYR